MATRATYTIINDDYHGKRKLDLYIHWDGYEFGALSYYMNAIELMDKDYESDEIRPSVKGGFIENFMYANAAHCEITDHKLHGDTEFHYEMSLEEIKIYTKHWDDKDFKLQQILTPLQFWNKYKHNFELCNSTKEFIVVNGRLTNALSVYAKMMQHFNRGIELKEAAHTGNASSSIDSAFKLCKVLLDQVKEDTELIESVKSKVEEIKSLSKWFAVQFGWHKKRGADGYELKEDLTEAEWDERVSEATKRWSKTFYTIEGAA
jgi:hypothetical protein